MDAAPATGPTPGFKPYVANAATGTATPQAGTDHVQSAIDSVNQNLEQTKTSPMSFFSNATKTIGGVGMGVAKGVASNPFEGAQLGAWLGDEVAKVPILPGLTLGQITQGGMKAIIGMLSPEQKAKVATFAQGAKTALNAGIQTPESFKAHGLAEEVGFGAEKAGEFFVPGMAEEKGAMEAAKGAEAVAGASELAKTASFGEKAATFASKALKPTLENLAVSAKEQGKVTPESALMASVSGVAGQLGKIPQYVLGSGQVASGVGEYAAGNKAQGLVDIGMGALGLKGAHETSGLFTNHESMTPAEVRTKALGRYEETLKPVLKEIKSQSQAEVLAARYGKEAPRPVSEVLFDEKIPIHAEHDGQALRYTTTDAQKELDRRISGLQETKGRLLDDVTPKHDLEALKQKAIDSVPAKTALEKQQMQKEVADYYDAEIAQHGNMVTDKQLDTIKGGFYNAGDWRTMTPGQAHVRRMATDLKTEIERSNPSTDLATLNKTQGDLIRANNYLKAMDGSVVRGGLMGKKLAGMAGAIVGHSLPIPIAGPLIGHALGEHFQERMINPNAKSNEAATASGFVPKSAQTRMGVEEQMNKPIPVPKGEAVTPPLAKGETSQTLYHGSASRFTSFDPSRSGSGEGSGLFGDGAYLTDSEAVANFYGKKAALKGQVEKYTPTGIFGTDEPVYRAGADAAAEKAKVVNKFIAKGNFFDASTQPVSEEMKSVLIDSLIKNNKRSVASATEDINHCLDYARKNASQISNFRGELPYLVDQVAMGNKTVLADIAKHLESKGFDGIKFASDASYEGAGSNNYFVFNPNKTLQAHLGAEQMLSELPKSSPATLPLAESALNENQKSILDSMYQRAPEVKTHIDKIADDVASQVGGRTVKPELKSAQSATRKILTDPETMGNPENVKDLARNTILVSDDTAMQRAMTLLKKHADGQRTALHETDEFGYSGGNTKVLHPNGVYGEIQTLTPEMFFAKEPEANARAVLGDAKYEELLAKYGQGGKGHVYYEKGRVLPPRSSARVAIGQESKAYYKPFVK